MGTRSSKDARRASSKLGDAAADASSAARQAASVLESELAAGLAGVRQLEARFTKEGRVDQKEFDAVLQRLRVNAHEFIDVAAARMADLRSSDVEDLSQRLTADAHDFFDIVINMLQVAPDVVNRLVAKADAVAPEPKKTTRAKATGARTTGAKTQPRSRARTSK